MPFDPKQAMTVQVAHHVKARPQDHGPEEVTHLARSYLALIAAVREYGPCPAGTRCGSPGCRALRTILNAADEG